MTRVGRSRVLLAALSLGGLAIAGCTASSQAAKQTGAASSAPPSVTSTAPTTAPPPTPASPTSSAAASTSAAPHTNTPTLPAVQAPRSTCTNVTIRVIRGSAARGFEFAALQFTNAGSSTCRLFGYPQAALRLRGKAVGKPAQPAGTAASRFTLKPGQTAESRLTDYTNCQAPLSDEVRVVVPGSSIHTIRPAQLRACVLRVSKLGQPE